MAILKELSDIISRTPLTVMVIAIGLLALLIGATGSLPIGDSPQEIAGAIWRAIFATIGFALTALGIWGIWRQIHVSSGNRELSESKPDHELYTFIGMRRELRTGDVFQDFVRRPNDNINAVYYLWADAFTASQIDASVQDESFLRISFNNQPGSYPCNVAIRPESEQALKNDPQKRYISFEARIPEESLQDEDLLSEVAIGIRLVNGWLQHWEYAMYPHEYIQFKLNNSEWKSCFVLLDDAHKWNLFKADGNHLYGPEEPDFGIIASVIIEVGGYKGPGRPSEGKGIIDIRAIRLTNHSE